MTLREAAAAVLARWDSPQWEWTKHGPTADLIDALRAALAQPAAPDAPPVAWRYRNASGHWRFIGGSPSVPGWDFPPIENPQPLYAAAQAAQPAPQPLSDSQLQRIVWRYTNVDAPYIREIARAVEAWHGITAAPTTGEPTP